MPLPSLPAWRRLYGAVECPLTHRNNFELLVAVILSAQCTDAAVNKVTPALIRRYPNPLALSQASLADIESLIRTLGLFRAKAKSLKRCAEQLVQNSTAKYLQRWKISSSLPASVERPPTSFAAMLLVSPGSPSIPTAAACRAVYG